MKKAQSQMKPYPKTQFKQLQNMSTIKNNVMNSIGTPNNASNYYKEKFDKRFLNSIATPTISSLGKELIKKSAIHANDNTRRSLTPSQIQRIKETDFTIMTSEEKYEDDENMSDDANSDSDHPIFNNKDMTTEEAIENTIVSNKSNANQASIRATISNLNGEKTQPLKINILDELTTSVKQNSNNRSNTI